MGRPNLFVSFHEARHRQGFDRIGTGWEDTLTEQFAFMLSVDDGCRDAVVRLLMGEAFEPAVGVEAQLAVGGDCPDLAIRLASGRLLLVEHKVGASLGREQLERYLRIRSPDGQLSLVALVSRGDVKVPPRVLANERYLHPEGRAHWFWQDVFRAIPLPESSLGIDHLRRSFRDYLELLGLSPSRLTDEWKLLLSSEMSAVPVQSDFGRRLAGVRQWFTDRGFTTLGDSHSGFQAIPGKGSEFAGKLNWLTVNPTRARKHLLDPEAVDRVASEALRVGIVFTGIEPPPLSVRIFERFPRPLVDQSLSEWWPVAPYRMTNSRIRLECVASLAPFLEKEEDIERRLTVGCAAVADELLRLVTDEGPSPVA